MANPYSGMPARRFWKKAVAPGLTGLYEKRFQIGRDMAVATAGSCFAQHIAENMAANGYRVLDVEPPPVGTPRKIAQAYGYRTYSARYANIYTARQLVQIAREATEGLVPSDPVWERGGRYFDAFRPTIEPEGFPTPESVRLHRQHHLRRFVELLQATDLFIFTFGLTEAWTHRDDGTVYPTAPGVHAGEYDPARHVLANYGVADVREDFAAFMAIARRLRPGMKFLVTVSPVPLAATASDMHVLAATIRSKSVLRAAAGELYDAFEDVDYFPSYELIGTPFTGAIHFERDLRSVSAAGVRMVMDTFFDAHGRFEPAPAKPAKGGDPARARRGEPVCEEAILEAFAP